MIRALSTIARALRIPITAGMAVLLPALPCGAAQAGPAGGAAAGDDPRTAVSRTWTIDREGVRPPAVGSTAAALLLRRMDGEKRVLMIGAHPDDEDTALLATLARGGGVRTAYLSLTRGEGGQNVIGSELGEGLGLVRTGELLAARELDGADQFFTRAFDFGYSKSAAETFSHWPRDEVLADVVWVLRTFRPQVVLTIFSGTPRDGHGQHQAAGILAREAFEVAGDPERFPEQLELGVQPWSPRKLYQLVRWNPDAAELVISTGTLDPLLGRSHFQVAMEGRSRHRSQDFGSPQVPGPRRTGATLERSRVDLPDGRDEGLFAGIDTTLAGALRAAAGPQAGPLLREIAAYREAVASAGASLTAADPARALPHLARGHARATRALELARTLPPGPSRSELVRVLAARVEDAGSAILAAAGVMVDVRVDRMRLVPGETAGVEVLVWNGGSEPVRVERVAPLPPPSWSADLRAAQGSGSDGDGDLFASYFTSSPETLAGSLPSPAEAQGVAPDGIRRWSFRLAIPPDATPSRPWYLREARDGALYRWPDDPLLRARPRDPPLIPAVVDLRVGDSEPIRIVRGAAHVGLDPVNGEFRTPVFVVPRVSVEADPERMAWAVGGDPSREVTVRARNLSGAAVRGELRVSAPPGWRVEPAAHEVELPTGGVEIGRAFTLHPGDAGPGEHFVEARLEGHGQTFTLVDHPHMDPFPLVEPAGTRISRFPVRVREGLRVGYVMGSGDEGARALRDLGVDVELLAETDLRSGPLDRFHTIVLGIRAYETRPDLAAANAALLDFARSGGTVVVQYHRYDFPAGGYAPYPLSIRRPHDRVTDPEAPVRMLVPDHPLLRGPNRIEAADFEGWVQERGLYFLGEWDERYTPLLEMADPGEPPVRGALVVARVGEGAWIYTGLALFRQLPAGVPGAHRLLANLVSLRGGEL